MQIEALNAKKQKHFANWRIKMIEIFLLASIAERKSSISEILIQNENSYQLWLGEKLEKR